MPSTLYPTPMSTSGDNTALLEDTLRNRRIAILFQPILAICDQEVYGYEALARGPEDTVLHAPMALFEAARYSQRMLELELLCRELAIEQFGRMGLPGKLFLNVSPEALLEPGFRSGRTLEFLEAAGTDPSQVVIELTEHYPIQDFDLMREAVTHYREMGFAIAIDDLGSGYAGLRQWSELRPDYVKIDRHFIQDIPSYPGKRQFVHSIGELAKSLECRVIAEGVESLEELQVVRHLGVSLGQGYHFARPATAPPRAIPRQSFGGDCQCSPFWHLTDAVGSLLQDRPPLDSQVTLNEVVELFHHAPDLVTLPVVDNHRPLGIVRRYELMNLYTSRFGRELHGRKPISAFMRTEPLIVGEGTPVEKLSRRITDGDKVTTVDDDFIITDDEGRYLGMGTVVELLKKITELQIRNARYANPLTQLPGNVPIDEHIDRLLAAGEEFVVAYCDLDNFKPFNDTYGYARGDEVLRWLGRLLVEQTVEGRDFVGHVGGDDFILILRSGDWRVQSRTILDRFEAEAPGFYDQEARDQGGIAATDRKGNKVFYGFLSLSIGAVPAGPSRFNSHYEVASLTSEVKAQAKKEPGSSLFVDRRGLPDGDCC